MVEAAEAILKQQGVPGTGIPGVFSHPSIVVNMVFSALQQSEVPLDEKQARHLGDLGDAYVAEDERRYFRVLTPLGDIKVFGTIFGVEVSTTKMVVTVAEGTVQVENGNTFVAELNEGYQVELGLGDKHIEPHSVEPRTQLAWADALDFCSALVKA